MAVANARADTEISDRCAVDLLGIIGGRGQHEAAANSWPRSPRVTVDPYQATCESSQWQQIRHSRARSPKIPSRSASHSPMVVQHRKAPNRSCAVRRSDQRNRMARRAQASLKVKTPLGSQECKRGLSCFRHSQGRSARDTNKRQLRSGRSRIPRGSDGVYGENAGQALPNVFA
jgi:hypothetical protein